MATWREAAEPRNRAATARTLLVVASIATVVTAGWEILAHASARPGTTLATSTLAIGGALVILVVAGVCARDPQRVPGWLFAGLAVLGVALVSATCLANRDASAAGLYGFLYPVVYAAAHFRRRVAWLVTGLAVGGGGIVTTVLLPSPDSLADLLLVGTALVMLTTVLVSGVTRQERLMDRLHTLAWVDGLTGLVTRRKLVETARELLDPARSVPREDGRATSVGLLLVDVDHFKGLNDTHGHPIGDTVLVHVAGLVSAAVRPSDTVARLGGDELAVLLQGPSLDIAARARAVHATVRRAPVDTAAGPVAVTVSVGAAQVDVGHGQWEDLYAAADAALYDAKLAGRDAVATRPSQQSPPGRHGPGARSEHGQHGPQGPHGQHGPHSQPRPRSLPRPPGRLGGRDEARGPDDPDLESMTTAHPGG